MPLAPVWKKSWKKAATKHEGYAALCPLIATSLSDLVPPVVALATAGCFICGQDNSLYLYSLSIRSAIRLAIGLAITLVPRVTSFSRRRTHAQRVADGIAELGTI